jgi:hypothetical protein
VVSGLCVCYQEPFIDEFSTGFSIAPNKVTRMVGTVTTTTTTFQTGDGELLNMFTVTGAKHLAAPSLKESLPATIRVLVPRTWQSCGMDSLPAFTSGQKYVVSARKSIPWTIRDSSNVVVEDTSNIYIMYACNEWHKNCPSDKSSVSYGDCVSKSVSIKLAEHMSALGLTDSDITGLSTYSCANKCKNGGECINNVCQCPVPWMGNDCNTKMPVCKAGETENCYEAIAFSDIVPGAGKGDTWLIGSTRDISFKVSNYDSKGETQKVQVFLVNRASGTKCPASIGVVREAESFLSSMARRTCWRQTTSRFWEPSTCNASRRATTSSRSTTATRWARRPAAARRASNRATTCALCCAPSRLTVSRKV